MNVTKGFDTWTVKLDDASELPVSVDWYVKKDEGSVEVILGRSSTDPIFTTAKGSVRVTRMPSRRIALVEVSSLNGDVVGRGRSVADAARDYASKVAGIFVQRARQDVRAESQIETTGLDKVSPGQKVIVTLTNGATVRGMFFAYESRSGLPAVPRVAIANVVETTGDVFRYVCGDGHTRIPLSAIKSVVKDEAAVAQAKAVAEIEATVAMALDLLREGRFGAFEQKLLEARGLSILLTLQTGLDQAVAAARAGRDAITVPDEVVVEAMAKLLKPGQRIEITPKPGRGSILNGLFEYLHVEDDGSLTLVYRSSDDDEEPRIGIPLSRVDGIRRFRGGTDCPVGDRPVAPESESEKAWAYGK